ncbi:subtilisin family serine protease [Kibdelosporangium banguiense]|uniref:Subtilisin family serine protease n=1 Tax=Kibdelosporangium banguiense TaxID=1365924 RepID=A0ABS4TKW9_9PSEU|nr:S8 family peptidase [Kibdelosporangium banguiense]MBP2324974.1 subtilisin family serine protease [Kibdelosporangium banguiense]
MTLLTGDKVTLGGMYGVNVQAGKGRKHVNFFSRTDVRGDTHVVPDDAAALLSQGKLDPRLFNVSELVRASYHDKSRDRLPLIVDYAGAAPRMAGVQVGRELPALNAAAVSIERTPEFWATARNARHIWLDGPVRASLDQSVPQIGAPEAWASGHTGAGTTVAVLDTGIDTTHPDLSDAVTAEQNFTGSDTSDDRTGHGTHVASTITGNSAKYRGVAPDAKLLNAKVLDDFGGGLESWIIAGMQWAASRADVVNMSLGNTFPSDGADPLSQAVNRLTAETGALFVTAAGNSGGLIGSPGAADAALTVGSVDKKDDLAASSSRGRKDGAIKPDITAPGVDIVAAKAKNGQIGDPAGDGYVSLSGTSMAAPHVSGAAAVLAGQHPDWSADRLKAALMGSAKPNAALSVFEQGAGRVDVAKAVTSTVSASVGSFSLGTVQWPHHDDQPIKKPITYTNTGSAPVTLGFTTAVIGPNGSPAPQGMFTVEPAQLTVPAGGQATATAITNTKVDGTDGAYSGSIIAAGDGQSVRTPMTVNREIESYDVTVKAIDHNGTPTGMYWSNITDFNNRVQYQPYDPSGIVTVRVPKGEFVVTGSVQTEIAQFQYRNTEFVEPAVMVTGDTELKLDARLGKQVGFTVDRPNAKVGSARFQYTVRTAWGGFGVTADIRNYDSYMFKPSTISKKDRLTFVAEARMGEWNGASFDGSPYIYHVRHTENGAVPQHLQWHFRNSELAKVRSEHAAATLGKVGYRENFLTLPLPSTLTEYYTPNEPWESFFREGNDPANGEETARIQQRPRSLPLGRTTTERWNTGVFGPALPNTNGRLHLASRTGDRINLFLSLFADQGASRLGYAEAEGTTALLRDGKLVGESPMPGNGKFDVAPERAQYTMRTSADRSTRTRLSTKVSAEWTFTSEHVSGQETDLPLLAVRFAPDLDDRNAAPAGKRFTFPVLVQRNGSDVTGRVSTPVVEVSYDDGTTWQAATVKRDHDQWKTTADHPAGAQFVSLRSSVTDPDGNAQRQTIIRAYALK